MTVPAGFVVLVLAVGVLVGMAEDLLPGEAVPGLNTAGGSTTTTMAYLQDEVK